MLKFLLIAAAIVAIPATAAPRDPPDVRLDKLLAGRVSGKPIGCISLRSIQSSAIIEGRAIVYRIGRTLYVNEPRSGADTLRVGDVLLTKTHGSQLCSIDTVQLIDRGSRFNRGFVFLGKFVPYTKARGL